MATIERGRLLKTGTLSAGVVLATALFLIVNYFGWKYYKRFDWTGSHLYTLSEKSRNVLRDLKSDVEFIVLLPAGQNTYEPTRELLSRYAAASRHVRVRVADPEKNPLETQQLATRYQISNPSVVVVRGKDRRVIDAADLADFDFSGMQMGQQQPEMTGFKGEQLFTGALLQLAEGRKPKILFTTGHGEHALDDQKGTGLSGAQDILGRDNFEMGEWASLGKPAVPPGTDLLVIAGPTSSFLPPELAALKSYLDGGGRLLVMLDPTLGPPGSPRLVDTGLEGFLAAYGVKVGQDVVVDPANGLPMFSAVYLYAQDYGEHPITKVLRSGRLPVLIKLARSVAKGSPAAGGPLAPMAPDAAGAPAGPLGPGGPGGHHPADTVTELLRTSNQGWGETDLAHLERVTHDASDVAGPVPVGVAVERRPAGGKRGMRLLVFGDSDFATNQLLRMNAPNTILLANSLNWLAEREALLAIPPRKTEQVHLSLTRQQLYSILGVLLLMPGLAVVAGTYVYFVRRR
jgi:ABC-type uncharacterized transport system involved in gliding motility auxiliary subunit